MAKAKTAIIRRRRAPAKKTNVKRRKKTMASKVKPIVLPGAASIAFLAPYLQKSKATGTPVLDLVRADIENFDTDASIQRIKTALPKVAGLAAAGVVLKETKLIGKYSGVGSDIALGLGLGTLGKAILDPPSSPNSLMSQRGGRIIDMQRQANGGYGMRNNPYDYGGS